MSDDKQDNQNSQDSYDTRSQDRDIPEQSGSTNEVDADRQPPRSVEQDIDRNILILYLPQRDDPLVFKDAEEVTLGRADPDADFYPTVDLTPDRGFMLGVSRLHARIRLIDDNYYLEDMRSTNGTWLNTIKLEPGESALLSSNDQIRLSHLMMLVLINS